MSASWILHRLYSQDPSSLRFLRHLSSLIRHDEEEHFLDSLQGLELARLVDFLDGALSAISANHKISRQCLRKLQSICDRNSTLPSSYILSDEITTVDDDPIALGDNTELLEGSCGGKRVSVKRPNATSDGNEIHRKIFFKGAVIWKSLRHPNIVPFVGATTSPLQIVSEWMSNGTLMVFIQRNPGTNRIGLLLDIAEGLNYLHANDVVHGNLKALNVFVNSDGHACLTDFEFTSIVRGMGSVTQESGYTVTQPAPQALDGTNTFTRESDVFAFSTVTIEVFMGNHPGSEFSTQGDLPALPQEAEELGPADSVWSMTARCRHLDPAQRPTMSEVVKLLRECYMLRAADLHHPPLAAARSAGIAYIPAEVFTNNILPFCELEDALSLGCTNKFFATIANDETFWKRKLAADYNFTGLGTARTNGWKFLYRRLRTPQVYIWGGMEEGQARLPHFPGTLLPDVPFPVKLHLPGVRVVSLVTSRTAFHVLGADGSVHVWGTLDGTVAPPMPTGFSNPHKTAWSPLKLRLPAPTRSVSCGFFSTMTLGADSVVWNFMNWGRPFRLVSPLLDCSSPETTPIQIECNYPFSAVLTASGDVCVWWPFEGALNDQYRKGIVELDEDESTKAIVPDGGTIIPCHTWEIEMDPVKLPALPELPDLPATGIAEEERRKETKLSKIATFNDCIVGLTNKGHVLKIDGLDDEDFARVWAYLPNFSDIDKVKKHPAFCATTGNDGLEIPLEVEPSSDTMLVTHVSARKRSFVVYSSSLVLIGGTDTTPETLPRIKPELQNRSVISVAIGDFHFGVLSSSGKLLMWGQNSKGALGLGDPHEFLASSSSRGGPAGEEQQVQAHQPQTVVTVPTEVRFDHYERLEGRGGVERYCFAVIAGEHHTAALVVDLEREDVQPDGLEHHIQTPQDL